MVVVLLGIMALSGAEQSRPCVAIQGRADGQHVPRSVEQTVAVRWSEVDPSGNVPRVLVSIERRSHDGSPAVVLTRAVDRPETSFAFRFINEARYKVSVDAKVCHPIEFDVKESAPESTPALWLTPTAGFIDGFKPAIGVALSVKRFGVAAAWAPWVAGVGTNTTDVELSLRSMRSISGAGFRRRFGVSGAQVDDPDEVRRENVGYVFSMLELPPVRLLKIPATIWLGLELRALPLPGEEWRWRQLRALGLRLQVRATDPWGR